MMMDPAASTLHACCIAMGDFGVLIRGPSGSGKSTLALSLILDAPRALSPAELVADDRVRIERRDGALIARAPERLAGLMEVRGLGLRRLSFRPQVALTHVVDLGAEGPRLPEAGAAQVLLEGLPLRHIVSATPERARLLLAAALATADYDE